MKRMRKRMVAGGVAAVVVASGLLIGSAATATAAKCSQPAAEHEPPCNPALPDSPWSVSHRNSYAQASSPYRGLESGDVDVQHIDLPGTPVALQFSNKYKSGNRAVWGSLVAAQDDRALFKVNERTGELIDLYIPAEREPNPPDPQGGGITGSYNILDRDGHFIVPRQRQIEVYGDKKKGKLSSNITLIKRFDLPQRALCRPDDTIAGATMTYDGYIAFATELGVVGTVPRQPKKMKKKNVRTLYFNSEQKCADESIPTDQLEEVSNSIAADENGGIYVVTSKRMRRVNHDADTNTLTKAWKARYNAGNSTSPIRLGLGSGSTPSLMGTGDQDKFVVITDGQDLMHVDLFWRNKIPKRWDGLGKNKPARMACETPVKFGDPNATASLSEQSVTVNGYGTMHVNNLLDYDFGNLPEGPLRNATAALRGGDPAAAPHGAERIDWDPAKMKCKKVWANKKVSIPNAIPSMSSPSNRAYGIGQKHGEWGVQGLNWRTGKSKFFARAQVHECSEQVIEWLSSTGLMGFFGPLLNEMPNSCENSFYAATEVGPRGTIFSGTFMGMTIYRPAD